MDDVIYTSAQVSPCNIVDTRTVTLQQLPPDPAPNEDVIENPLLNFHLMQLDDLEDSVTRGDLLNKPLEPFEKFTAPMNSFTPNLLKLIQDAAEIGRTVQFSPEGTWYTVKQI